MLRWKGSMAVLTGVLLCGAAACPSVEAAPIVEIGGLSGAEHWVWMEGEYYTSGNGSATFRDNQDVSGWMAGGPANAYNRTTGSYNVGSVNWTIHAPAAMSDGTRIYARASINRDEVGMTILMDGSSVASGLTMLTSGLTNPTNFLDHKIGGVAVGAGVPVGALAVGSHAVRYTGESASVQGFTSFMVDGILLYDGSPVLHNVETDADRHWLGNPGSADSPELAGPVTPTFSITGLEAGQQVHYLLDGVAYTPGTMIGVGEHELVVFVTADSGGTSQRLTFAGANFTVVPEPASLAVLATGALFVRHRRRSAR